MGLIIIYILCCLIFSQKNERSSPSSILPFHINIVSSEIILSRSIEAIRNAYTELVMKSRYLINDNIFSPQNIIKKQQTSYTKKGKYQGMSIHRLIFIIFILNLNLNILNNGFSFFQLISKYS